MRKYLVNALKLLISLGLGVALVVWFINKMTPDERQQTIDAFKRANYFWIALAPVVGFISNYFRSERWRMLLEPTGHKPRVWNTFFSVMVMYFLNLFFPRLGEVSRCGVLARYENVPLDKSIGTMVVERLVDLVSILLIGGFLLLVEYKRLFGYFDQYVIHKQTGVPPAGNDFTKWVVLIAIIVVMLAAAAYIQYKYGFKRLREIIKERLIGFFEGLKSIKDLRNPLGFIGYSILIWVCYWLMIYLSFFSLPETSHLSVYAGMACLFIGGFAFVATPGGIGAYPFVIQQVLLLYGVDAVIGGAFGSVVWAAQTASVMLGGVISLILLAIINREPSLKEVTLKT
ncbi:MAG TPA: lysylphosphatidylglycerol synthase transmembrane domain-containing protein [Chitinophagales bacterium]|nr:lysylphosphatidylglycerol synthase transmembrane domain-containing protein [Chitinophagales bacterium]